jgi:hypothetical protein
MPEPIETNIAMFALADSAVKELNLESFIDKHWSSIEVRLFDADTHAAEAETTIDHSSAGMVFFAECVPYVAAVLHAGSALENFVKAKEWVTRQASLHFADPVSVLAILTFIYLIQRGADPDKTMDQDTRSRWEGIRRRVNALFPADTGLMRKLPRSA